MTWNIINGHTIDEMNKLPEKSVQTIITSPPYWALRAYGTNPQIWGGDSTCEHVWDEFTKKGTTGGKGTPGVQSWHGAENAQVVPPTKYGFCSICNAWRGELGSEPTPELFIEHLMMVFDACHRVLRNDGIMWINIADSYAGSGKGPTGKGGIQNAEKRQNFTDPGAYRGITPKSMCLVPERMLIAMTDRGWILRSKIRLIKTSAMPESIKDRPSNATEELYMFTKQGKYFYDQDAVRNENLRANEVWASGGSRKSIGANPEDRKDWGRGITQNMAGANLKNWWYWTPEPATYEFCTNCDGYFDGIALRSIRSKHITIVNAPCEDCGSDQHHTAKICPNCGKHSAWINHYAAFPTWLPEKCIKASTSLHGACAKCGAPYERVIEKPKPGGYHDHSGDNTKYGLRQDGIGPMSGSELKKWKEQNPTINKGWQATCTCDCEEVVPCTVLDPFSGSGTTALVADRLGMNGVGIELNPHYYALSLQRIKSDAPLVAAVEEQTEKMVQTNLFEMF